MTPRKKSTLDTFVYTVITASVVVVLLGIMLIVFRDQLPLEGIFGSGELPEVDFAALEVIPGEDHFLACPANACPNAVPDQMAEPFRLGVTELRDRLFAFVDRTKSITPQAYDFQNLQFDFAEYAPGRPFPDLVTVKLYDLGENRSAAAIYSRTLQGSDDTGENRKRVARWLRALRGP